MAEPSSKSDNGLIQNGTTLKVRAVEGNTNALYQLASPYQVAYECCSGLDGADYFNSIILSPLESSLYTISMSQYPDYYARQGVHCHDFYEFMVVLEGNVLHRIGEREYQYGAGSCCLINRNIKHTEKPLTSCKLLYLDLSMDFIREIFNTYKSICFKEETEVLKQAIFNFIENDIQGRNKDAYLDIYPVFRNTECLTMLHNIAEHLIYTLLHPQFGASYLVKYLLCRFIEYFSQGKNYHITPVPHSLQSDRLIFSRVRHLIEDAGGQFSRSDLENHFYYSADYICKIVKKYSGLSFNDYCMGYLLKKAGTLLVSTDMPVLSIMEELGFSNHTYFYKKFESQYGMTPKAYREKNRN